MHKLPECLNRRYLALDALIEDISRQQAERGRANELTPEESSASVVSEDPAIRLMCHFWNILKEEPDCDLPAVVQEQLCPREARGSFSTNFAVYMADKNDDNIMGRCPKNLPCISDCKGKSKSQDDANKDAGAKMKGSGGGINIRDSGTSDEPEGTILESSPGFSGSRQPPVEGSVPRSSLKDGKSSSDKGSAKETPKRGTSKELTSPEPKVPSDLKPSLDHSQMTPPKSQSSARKTPSKAMSKDPEDLSVSRSPEKVPTILTTFRASSAHSASPPLSKVLSDLQKASAYDKKCGEKLKELLTAESQLQETIQQLETKEKKAIELLKKADCMWTCMEDQYKKKLEESEERQKHLLAELEEVDKSLMKWRKNAQDLTFQVENFEKYEKDITSRKTQKENDRKAMEQEIEILKKRIENDKMEAESVLKSMGPRQKATEETVINLNKDISRLEAELFQEQLLKQSKEREGQKGIKEARENLTEICKRLLRKKIENEDLMAERAALVDEIELLTQCKDKCKEKCDQRLVEIESEIEKIGDEIKESQAKCIRCNHGTDSGDIRRFCSDCPRCIEQRQCLVEGDTCAVDHAMDCICMTVKHKFVDNIFENIYSVLAKQASAPNGKAVAAAILTCMRKSRNGKLDFETREVIKSFVLDSIKKNLAVTIVGGAVKTRCEMEPETYEQLMLCLKDVKSLETAAQPKVDAGTLAKKDPCVRWAKSKECNCLGGPNGCICKKMVPDVGSAEEDLGPPCPCPKEGDPPPKDKTCPHKEPECDAYCSYPYEEESCENTSHKGSNNFNNTRLNSIETRIIEDDAATVGSKRQRSGRKDRKSKNFAAHIMYSGNVRMESRGTPALVSPDPHFEKVVCKCETKPQKDCCCCGKKDRKRPQDVVINDVYGEVYGTPAINSITVPLDAPTCSKLYTKQLSAEQDKNKMSQNDCDSDEDVERVKVEHTQLERTPSGHWELLLQEETISALQKRVQKSQNNSIVINKTDSGIIKINLAADGANPKKLSFLKRTASGQTIMKIRKSILNLVAPQEGKEESYIVTRSILKPTQPICALPEEINKSILKRHVDQLKMVCNIPRDIFDATDEDNAELQSTDSTERKHFSYLKINASDSSLRDHEVSLKSTKSGNYELVVKDDFDHESTLKYYLGEKKKRSVCLSRTIPGYYEVSFKKGKKVVKKNASLVRTRSGHIKVHILAPEFHTLSKSINIFLPNIKSKTSSKKCSVSGIVKKKSKVSAKVQINAMVKNEITDLSSRRYIVVRLFYKTECIAEFPAILRKLPGSMKAIVLKKNAKYSLLDYLVKYHRLKVSPTPVIMSESGIITIYLDKHPCNQRPNANLKVTLSKKNFYIVDELKPNEINIESTLKHAKKTAKKVTISIDDPDKDGGLDLISHKKLTDKKLLSEGCDTSDSDYLKTVFDGGEVAKVCSSSEMNRALSETDSIFHSASSSRVHPTSSLNREGNDQQLIVFKDKKYSIWTKPKDKKPFDSNQCLKIIEAFDKASETEKNILREEISTKPSKDRRKI